MVFAKEIKDKTTLRKNRSHNTLLENPWKSVYDAGDSQVGLGFGRVCSALE
jgi:hypothetical protein